MGATAPKFSQVESSSCEAEPPATTSQNVTVGEEYVLSDPYDVRGPEPFFSPYNLRPRVSSKSVLSDPYDVHGPKPFFCPYNLRPRVPSRSVISNPYDVRGPEPFFGPYNLRPRDHPRPNYYETRLTRRTWNRKNRRQNPMRTVCQQQEVSVSEGRRASESDLMEVAELGSETMGVDTYQYQNAIEKLDGEMQKCEINLKDNCSEKDPYYYSIPKVERNLSEMSCDQNNNTNSYWDTYPGDFCVEAADCCVHDSVEDSSSVYYRIPVISGGVVTPSWSEARIFLRRSTGNSLSRGSSCNESCASNEPITGGDHATHAWDEHVGDDRKSEQNTTYYYDADGNYVYLEEMADALNEVGLTPEQFENTLEALKREWDEEFGDWHDGSVSSGDTDVAFLGEYIRTQEMNNAGETNGPEEHPLDKLDLEQASNNSNENMNSRMIFGDNARWYWPLPSIFPCQRNL